METAVALVIFNRPGLTQQTVDSLRPVRPRRLFVIADGPRAGNSDDARLVAETRAVVDGVDWDCQVERHYRETNIGLEPNVELGLDWVFGQVDAAVVLEDDCVADPSFFTFADELLETYRDEPRVWQIAGGNFGISPARFGTDSYRFSTWGSVWGWATWADRWQRHRSLFPRDHASGSWLDETEPPLRTKPAVPQPGTLVTRAGQRHFEEAANSADGLAHGWDKHWWLSIMSEGGLTVVPSVTMVENVGFGELSTHGQSDRLHVPATSMTFPLQHPSAVALDVEIEREFELMLNRVGGRAANLARRLVKSPRARRALRVAADSPVAQWVARTKSRLVD